MNGVDPVRVEEDPLRQRGLPAVDVGRDPDVPELREIRVHVVPPPAGRTINKGESVRSAARRPSGGPTWTPLVSNPSRVAVISRQRGAETRAVHPPRRLRARATSHNRWRNATRRAVGGSASRELCGRLAGRGAQAVALAVIRSLSSGPVAHAPHACGRTPSAIPSATLPRLRAAGRNPVERGSSGPLQRAKFRLVVVGGVEPTVIAVVRVVSPVVTELHLDARAGHPEPPEL